MADVIKKIIFIIIILFCAQIINKQELKNNQTLYQTIEENSYAALDNCEKIVEQYGFYEKDDKYNYYEETNRNDILNKEYTKVFTNLNNDKIEVEVHEKDFKSIRITNNYSTEDFENDIDINIELIMKLVNIDISQEKSNIISNRSQFDNTQERQQYYTYIDNDYFTFYIGEDDGNIEFTIYIQML